MGGKVTFGGTPAALEKSKSPTGNTSPAPTPHRGAGRAQEAAWPGSTIEGAREHNLRGIDVRIPLRRHDGGGRAVSGAGKILSRFNGILLPAPARELHDSADPVGAHDAIQGLSELDKVIAIDQQPIKGARL